MVKQNQWRIFQSGIIIGIVLLVLNSVESWLASGLYAASDPALWQTMSGNWWLQMLVYSLVVGLVFALVYGVLHQGIPGQGLAKGVQYGFWVWLVGSVPGLLMTLMTMAVPAELVVLWLVSNLINLLVVGLILGAWAKFKE